MSLKQIDHGTNEYLQMVNLRDNVLRRPLGLTYSHDELMSEKDDILIACIDEGEMLGCCILTALNNETVRLRQMAVANKLHGKGIGASIMSFAENIARDKGFSYISMHARNTAIGFYEKFGYKTKGEEFIEVNVPHHVMEKPLKQH
jgi:predicted GNAT family N-acyltransferase